MAQRKTRDQTIDEEQAGTCHGNGQRESACPCGTKCACPKNARWACLALLVGGLGFVAFRTARRRARSSGSCCRA